MCLNPTMLPNGSTVGCRICWQCKQRRIDDWVGRCIAESMVCHESRFVTLTYGKDEYGNADHPSAVVLTYSDVQKWFKRLRKDGLKFKYFAVGEYGSMKGRAHWHILMYFQGQAPDVSMNERINDKYWPHGYSQWESASINAIRYCCKYITKNVDNFHDKTKTMKQYHLMMSKKPPLGYEYFQNLAQQYVDQRLAPQNLFYSFTDVNDKDGKKVNFIMSSVTADNFLEAFCRKWAAQRGGFCPSSDLVEEYLDKKVPDWRLPEKLATAQKRADIIRTDPKFEDRERFRREHFEFYFGAEARKLWENFDG